MNRPLLDGMPDEADVEKLLAIYKSIDVESIEWDNDESAALAEKLQQGYTMAELRGITQEEKDALLARGLMLIGQGQGKPGRMLLFELHKLDPLDPRPLFAIGSSYQIDGQIRAAALIYTQFMSMDATNPEGYLRLGECFEANGEPGEARAAYELALHFADRGRPGPDFAAQAKDHLAGLKLN